MKLNIFPFLEVSYLIPLTHLNCMAFAMIQHLLTPLQFIVNKHLKMKQMSLSQLLKLKLHLLKKYLFLNFPIQEQMDLCRAHLLPKLYHKVMNTLKKYNFGVYAWTDSKVVHSWLLAHPRKWKTFVANRTSQISQAFRREPCRYRLTWY